jgi:predicted nucleotidyltransferase component of viral defense system
LNLENISENTRLVLELLSEQKFMNRFTLVGGTALSLHLAHRLSEDLDFMFDGKFLESRTIVNFINNVFKGEFKLIKQDNDHQLDFIIKDVKVTFFTNDAVNINFEVKDHSVPFINVNIATVDIISTLKINTLAQRNTIRDYYDLYYIAKNIIPLENILQKSKERLPNIADITYSETIIYIDDLKEDSIDDHLFPKENITKNQIADFLTAELKKILKQN